ncbi:tripartite tricarboxylate transporter substrate binding protein [Bordetella petrii]|nr:tripartite tricarboxylate transporter substrate binding protein [Bordetella petrii]
MRLLSRCKPLILTLACLAGAATLPAAAQDTYPSKPIHLILPFPPGGPTDTVSRALGERLGQAWKVPVVVENRPGGNSFIATEMVAKAAPDGYSLLVAFFGTLVVNPSLYDTLPYDPVKDFAPVTTVATLPLMLVVRPDSPIHSINDVITLSKAQPNRFSFASGGAGQGAHLAGELLENMAGISMTHVPYKGNAPAIVDLLGGHVDMIFDGMTSSLPHVRSGKLRAVAISTKKRASAMPELPTVDESGLPGFDVGSWFGILAPAGTPKPVVDKLNAELTRIINSADMQQLLARQGLDPMPMSPQAFADYMRQETRKWEDVVRKAGIKIN